MKSNKQWEEAVAKALGWVQSYGLLAVDPSDFHPVRRDDGLSVAAGVARDWYGLPKTMNEWVRRTDGDWAAVAGPVESDPEWLRAGAGEWLWHLLGSHRDGTASIAALSRLRPDLVELLPWAAWMTLNDDDMPFVGRYLRVGGVARIVPESALGQYILWAENGIGWTSNEADSLARLSQERPDVVLRIPESVWAREDCSEPMVSRYLRFGGSVGAVPETAWVLYVSWVLGDSGWNSHKADSLAKLSYERRELIAAVPESVWLRGECSGEPIVSRYLRSCGSVSAVPEMVWPRYVSWAVGERGEQWQRAESLARLSLERPDLVTLVPESVWMLKGHHGEPIVSRYLRAGGAAAAVPESVLCVIEPLVPKDKSKRKSRMLLF